MTRHTINLLGGLVVLVLLVGGTILGVLPRLHDASQSRQQRDVVKAQNQAQQMLIAAYAEQRKQLPTLTAQVVALKQQIADGPHLEQLIDVASALPDGATLLSITPDATSTADGTTTTPPATATEGATPSTSSADGFQALPVTVAVALRKASDASAVLDRLRAGPRLFAIDRVTLSGAAGGGAQSGSTLTVGGRVFMKQGAQ